MSGSLSRRAFFALAPGTALAAEYEGQEPELSSGVGSWPPELGTRRARIRVREVAEAVAVRLRWRRRDNPAEKDLPIVEAATGRRIRNMARIRVDRHQADLVFEPYGAGEYYVYFAPYTANRLPHAYAIQYAQPRNEADPAWVERHRSLADLPRARVIDIQGRTEFDRPDPMEAAASDAETPSLLDRYPRRPYLVFAESRQHPVRMYEGVPLRWLQAGAAEGIRARARRGEFYVFQLAVWAARAPVQDVTLDFDELRSTTGAMIPASAFRCFNLGGREWLGRAFRKSVAVPTGRVGTLWCGVEVPRDAAAGAYSSEIVLRAKDSQPVRLRLAFEVEPQLCADGGDAESWRMSRLRWLDSTIGL
ncbi:MAG: glycoside hydrolase domain-containing protein, partial [Bryobacteraceae bacterium]